MFLATDHLRCMRSVVEGFDYEMASLDLARHIAEQEMLVASSVFFFLRLGAERRVHHVFCECSKSSRRSLFPPRCLRDVPLTSVPTVPYRATLTDGGGRVSQQPSLLPFWTAFNRFCCRYDLLFLSQSHHHRIVVADWSVDRIFLYHFFVARMICGNLCVWE